MPQPNLNDFNFQNNPYAAILSRMGVGGGQQPQPQPVPQMPIKPGMGQGMPQNGPMMKQPEDQTQPGANPGGSKFIIAAIQALQNYIKQSTDKDEIATARSILAVLTRLIERDQQNLMGQL